MNVPEDELLEDSIRAEAAHSVQDGIHVPNTVSEEGSTVINRKPLPSTPVLALGNRPEPPAKTFPDFQPSLDSFGHLRVNGRKPVTINNQQVNGFYVANPPLPQRPAEKVPPPLPARGIAEDSMPTLPPRRLQGPRPLHSRNGSVDTASLGQDLRKENVNPRRWSEQPDSFTTRDVRLSSAQSYGNLLTTNTIANDSKSSFLSITLIRRDPATGEQWNVGRITSGAASEDYHDSIASSDQIDLPKGVLIRLDSPGYHKFSKSKPSQDTESFGNTRGVMTQGRELSDTSLDNYQTETFRRVLQAGTSQANSNSPSPQRSEFGSSLDTPLETRPSMDSSKSSSHASYPKSQSELSSPGYYSFLSPWHGRCTFATSATGKSIKCKHVLPPGLRNRLNNASLDLAGLLVSELRFNLPSSNVFKLKTRDYKRPNFGQFSRSAGYHSSPQLPPRPQSGLGASQATNDDDVSSEDDEKMDLSLGQERAGGGFGGKKAKLGKLILQPEGLKMLDLLVAVNMAIWWKVYE